jgi:hypothetical protein
VGEQIWDRAVVWAHRPEGLAAAAWLAGRGVSVRLLCAGAFPERLAPPSTVRGPWSAVAPWTGERRHALPRLGVFAGGALHPAPRRKRDLWALLGATGLGAWAGALLDRTGGDDDARSWVRTRLGSAAYDRGLDGFLQQRLGGAPHRLPGGLARTLLGRRLDEAWALPDASERTQRWVDAVIEAGGEALEEVVVHGADVEAGRWEALQTEFGRERLEGPLVTDATPGQLAALVESAPFDRPPRADLVEVRLPTDGALPYDRVWVLGRRPPLLQVHRSGDHHVVAELVLPVEHPAHGAAPAVHESLARTLLEGIVEVSAGEAVVRRHAEAVARPRPDAWRARDAAYQRAAIVPVGDAAWGVPLGLGDLAAQLELLVDGAVVATQRQHLLAAGPPEEPWCLVGEG